MKLRTVLIAGTMLGVVALRAIAEEPANTNRPPRSTREHRFLVIVENSKVMGKRSEGVAHTVLDFIGSGMKGQVRRGDTLGLWLFNEELITGKFPLQKWGADNQQKVATSIVEFLDKQKFEKQGKPEKMLPSLSRVITNSQLITVLLISSGDAEVHGTGHDNEINAVYKQWREQQQRKKMPFVTLLRGKNGALTDVRVSPAPWPVEVPPLPPEPIVQAKPAAPAKKPVTILPPLIVSGKKPEVLPSPKPTEGATTNAASPVATALSATNANAVTTPAAGTSATAPPASAVTASAQTTPNPVVPSPSIASSSAEKQLEPDSSMKTITAALSNSPAATGATSSQAATGAEAQVAAAPLALTDQKSLTVEAPAAPAAVVPASPLRVPNGTFSTETLLLLALAVCLGALLAFAVPRAFRHRAKPAQVSLITQSLDRPTH